MILQSVIMQAQGLLEMFVWRYKRVLGGG